MWLGGARIGYGGEGGTAKSAVSGNPHTPLIPLAPDDVGTEFHPITSQEFRREFQQLWIIRCLDFFIVREVLAAAGVRQQAETSHAVNRGSLEG
jgi:hypothetical protein